MATLKPENSDININFMISGFGSEVFKVTLDENPTISSILIKSTSITMEKDSFGELKKAKKYKYYTITNDVKEVIDMIIEPEDEITTIEELKEELDQLKQNMIQINENKLIISDDIDTLQFGNLLTIEKNVPVQYKNTLENKCNILNNSLIFTNTDGLKITKLKETDEDIEKSVIITPQYSNTEESKQHLFDNSTQQINKDLYDSGSSSSHYELPEGLVYNQDTGILTIGTDREYGGLYIKNLAMITANKIGTENGTGKNLVLLNKDAKYYTSTETQKEE